MRCIILFLILLPMPMVSCMPVIKTIEPATSTSLSFANVETSTATAIPAITRARPTATLLRAEESALPDPSPAPPTPTAVPTATPNGEPVFIGADDPRIRYTGRFDSSDASRPVFDWSGTTIEMAFSGTSLTVLLEDDQNLYNVSVDGQSEVLEPSAGQMVYLVAEDLPDGSHVARITKRTEAYVGKGAFSGLILDSGHDLQALPPAAERHIEFVGDSITNGYGNEGDSPYCWFTPETENVELAYAAQTARYFGADYNVVALSGLGVLRNLRDTETGSPQTAIDIVDRALAMNADLFWDSPEPGPDAVVVNLGTNDYSSRPYPDTEAFVTAYVNLLEQIRQRYPETYIFAMAGPLMFGPAPEAIRTAVERQRDTGHDERVHYVLIENTLEEADGDFGCDWHPSEQGHREISEQLVPEMAAVLGW